MHCFHTNLYSIFITVGRATSAFAQAANFARKGPDNSKALPEIETLEEKTKRMIVDDPDEWLKFQEHLRETGVSTSTAARESLIPYLNKRRSEAAIDRSLDVWQQSERRLSVSMGKFRKLADEDVEED